MPQIVGERNPIRLSNKRSTDRDRNRAADLKAMRERLHPHTRGLGDVVASATKAVGVKPCAPCAQRQAALNKATPGWVAKILSWFRR